MKKRYFIIFFWGLKQSQQKDTALPPAITQFYSNMDCTTDGEYPSCEQITIEGKKLMNATNLVVTSIQELSEQDFMDWNKKTKT